jgi:glutamate racemase
MDYRLLHGGRHSIVSPSMNSAPVGVFDSGVGGLSVLREIRTRLPSEDLIYVADSGFVPYGNKPPEVIRERSTLLSRFLVEHGTKAIVIACNTATAAAAVALRTIYDLPIIGMEPAVKPAAAATRSGVVGVLATVGTLKSAQFAALLAKFGKDVRVVTQPAPGLVEIVEQGRMNHPDSPAVVATFVQPLLDAGADVIVLGCTHYPFLSPLITKIAGPNVRLIETGSAVATHLLRLLADRDLLSPTRIGTETFYTTGDLYTATSAFKSLWSGSARVSQLAPLSTSE